MEPLLLAVELVVWKTGVRTGVRMLTHISESDVPQGVWPAAPGTERIIVEMGGGMAPIIELDSAQTDRRKGK